MEKTDVQDLKPRHWTLIAGIALMLATLFIPWETIIAYYYPGQNTRFIWSPAALLWNALVDAFPNAPVVNAWVNGLVWPFVIVFTLYIISTSLIAVCTRRLIRSDLLITLKSTFAIWLFFVDAVAGILALFGWLFLPYVYLWDDGAWSMYPTVLTIGDGLFTLSALLAFLGVVLVGGALFDIAMAAHNRTLRAAGRMLAVGEEAERV
jgi:hypothetical protein